VKAGFRNKTTAVFLAAALGAVGAHRFYLEGATSKRGWGYATSFLILFATGFTFASRANPAFGLNLPYDLFVPWVLLAALPVIAAFLDAIYIGLTPDRRFDDRFNTTSTRTNRSGGLLVALVALSLGVGSTLMTTVLAVDLEALVGTFSHHTLDE
jgi:hypothetical protein